MIRNPKISICAALLLSAPAAFAQGVAPDSFANTVLYVTVTGSTGGLPGAETDSAFFASDGIAYSIATNGMLFANPREYTYAKLDADSAVITDPEATTALEFTSATAGTFVSTFTDGTQSGTFTIEVVSASFGGPELVNLSARTMVNAGGSSIGGFVVGGATPQRILIRAVGPGLAPFLDNDNFLADPNLVVRSTTSDEPIGTNDNWSADTAAAAELQAAFTSTGAFGLASGSADAAILLTLQPGGYTAVVSGGTAEQSGEVLIEVYLVPADES